MGAVLNNEDHYIREGWHHMNHDFVANYTSPLSPPVSITQLSVHSEVEICQGRRDCSLMHSDLKK